MSLHARSAMSLHAMIRIATLCLAAYWLAIFTATHLPKESLPHLGWSDKVYHALAFSGLSFLLAWALPARQRLKHLLVVSAVCMVYACLDEYTQQFVAGRTADVWDVVADLVGVLIGVCAYTVCRQFLVSQGWGRRVIQLLSR